MLASPKAADARVIPQPHFAALIQAPAVLRTVVLCAVAGILAEVWIPFAPPRLFDFDAANFALALHYFHPGLHQPQPPGYPLYVALTKLIQLFAADVTVNFLIAGLLGASAAVVMLWILGERMFGRETGILAALLLMTNPILWQTGMSDQVRIYIAVISIAIAWSVWPLYEGRSPGAARRLAISAFLLGLLAGFRPEMLVSMSPLVAIAAVRSRLRVREWVIGILALCVGMGPWLIVLVSRVGGIGVFIRIMRAYSAAQAGRTSVLFGSSWGGEWKMFSGALWWVSLGVAAWIPALLCVRRRNAARIDSRKWFFLMVWFLSLFLFSVVVHIAASGHALGFIPVLCIAGGWVLSNVRRTRGWTVMVLCTVAALGLNVLFFFKPYSKGVKEASYKTVGVISYFNQSVLQRVDWITQQNRAFLVTDGSSVSWRILEYYYPDNTLLFIPNPAAPSAALPVWQIRNRSRVQDVDGSKEIQIPSCGTIIWLIANPQWRSGLLENTGAEDDQYFVTTTARPGQHFSIGQYRLTTSSQPCRSAG